MTRIWQPHTVRGFVSILGNKGGEKIESSKSVDGELLKRLSSRDVSVVGAAAYAFLHA